ncbi:MAG TPA: hypothetical protein DEP84_17070, partial [Chloroflexi bacterium]|nr:hypothetical protein [Chloroflexota bacterium]
MKLRTFTLLAALALVLALIVPTVGAQGITYSSGFQVQNLSGNTANISITFYNQDGSVAGSTSDTIAANSSKTYFPIPVVSNGFNGSAVISSDQPVAAITNLLGNYPTYGGSTTGFTSGANSVGLPLIMRNNNGFSTWFNVQNTGSSPANVTVTYRPAPGQPGNSGQTDTATIQPGAAKTFNQADKSGLGSTFIGSATVASDQPVVAMVNQVGTGGIQALLMYDGFTGGSNTVQAPLIMANNSGFFTGLSIQNVGGSDTTATIDYSANTAGAFNPTDETVSIPAGGSAVVLQNAGQWGSNKYIGGATVSASQPLEVVVNQLKIGTVSFGTAYEGFNPTNLTDKVSAPLLMANNSGFYTGVQCQNTSGSSTTVSVAYGPNTAG